ncbi:TPA: 50S ribosomal protein L32e [Candidatus Micrarchaeota archaeon]|nr:50S ribosomal protein L32e [Candidatus Micrarchaeota archaeon]
MADKEKPKKRPGKKKKPTFNVMNLGFKKRVKSRWRKPRGTHNKKRMGKEFTGASPNIGYRNPASVRGLGKGGLPEMLVSNVAELEGAKDVVLRISSKVGKRKRMEIQKKAETMGLRVLNVRKGTEPKKAAPAEKKAPAPAKPAPKAPAAPAPSKK